MRENQYILFSTVLGYICLLTNRVSASEQIILHSILLALEIELNHVLYKLHKHVLSLKVGLFSTRQQPWMHVYISSFFSGRVSSATIWLIYQKVVWTWPLNGLLKMLKGCSVSKELILIRVRLCQLSNHKAIRAIHTNHDVTFFTLIWKVSNSWLISKVQRIKSSPWHMFRDILIINFNYMT